MVTAETDAVREAMNDPKEFPPQLDYKPGEVERFAEYGRQTLRLFELATPLAGSVATATCYGDSDDMRPWRTSLQRIARECCRGEGAAIDSGALADRQHWERLRQIPALLVMTSGTFLATETEHWIRLRDLTQNVRAGWPWWQVPIWNWISPDSPYAVSDISSTIVQGMRYEELMPKRRFADIFEESVFDSWYILISYLTGIVQPHLPLNDYFIESFAKNTIVLGLLAEDYNIQHWRNTAPNGWYGPTLKKFPIRPTWDLLALPHPSCTEVRVISEALEHGVDWGPLKAGLFGGSLERLEAASEAYLNTCARIRDDLERLEEVDSEQD